MKFLLYLCALVICIPFAPPCVQYLAKSRVAYGTITGPCPETLAKNLAKSRFLRHSDKATG